MAWGYHLMLDCAGGQRINDKEHMRNFIKELVPAIDMIAFGEPWIEHFATHAADKAGLSFCQMIETSNICGHFVDSTGDFYIDIFSCKPFELAVAAELVEKYFSPKTIGLNFIERTAVPYGPDAEKELDAANYMAFKVVDESKAA
jgi:S-adenosylmethionine decarboxylase